MQNAIHRLLKPRSVAVIGASTDATKTAGRPVAYLRKHGFTGAIYPVNPRAQDIDGIKCYPDIASIPETPDVAIVLLGVERAHLAVRELAVRGTAAAIVLASGYAETGEEGGARQQQLRDAAGSMRILGPNTIGLVNLTDSIILSASGALDMERFPAGNIGIVSQSGGILGSLLSRAAARGIGLSKLIATSNEADLDLCDFVDALADDEATDVIALYVEGIRNPKTFRRAAAKAARAGKPVVAFKIGRSEAGARAAVSHTGAMAGEDAMYDAYFEQTGVIRAQTFGDLLDISAALATKRKLSGNRAAIITSTGGAGTLVSDALGLAGFETPPPDEATAAALRALQTGAEAVLDRNPIDVTLAGLQPAFLRNVIATLLDSPSYDALVVIVGSSGIGQPKLMADAIASQLHKSDKPVLAFVSPHAPEAAAVLTQYGIPSYIQPENCAAALDGLRRVSCNTTVSSPQDVVAQTDVSDIPLRALDEAEAKTLFARFGITGVKEIIVASADEATRAAQKLGPRVVLKILSRDITHKSDVGGVAVGVDAVDMSQRFAAMQREVGSKSGQMPDRFVVQEMTEGAELILGLRRDALGSAILLGMGGVTAELMKDTALCMLPETGGVSRDQAFEMVRSLKSWPLLDGYRGRPKADVQALVSAICNFSKMAAQLGAHLVEAEINPLFVLPEGRGVKAADGVAVLSQA